MYRALSLARASRLVPLALLVACHAAVPASAPSQAAQPAPVDPATAAAREAIRREAALDVSSIPERAIAVPPLDVVTADTALAPLGYGLADMMMTDLAQSKQVIVVERSRLDAMLRELRLAQSGRVDSTQAPRVGRLVGARRLVVGSVSARGGNEFGIETRLANTVDGTLAGAVSARAPLASIFDAEKALVYRLFDQLGVTLTPEERARIEQRPTASVGAFLAYSRGVRDEAFGQYASAAANYQAAVTADPAFGAARARLSGAQTSQRSTSSTAIPVAEAKSETKEATADVAAPGTAGAVALAGGAINPSPVVTLGGGATSNTTQQQTSQQDRGTTAQKQPVFTTVIINIRQLP